MIADHLLPHAATDCRRALVFSAGGSADLVFAKTIALALVARGVERVDLAQPLNCQQLSAKGLLEGNGRLHGLGPATGVDPELVLRHSTTVPVERLDEGRRGKGLSISAAMDWPYGERYVMAAHGGGPRLLAGRRDGATPFYDLAVGVDGGGDVLTHDEREFDRIVASGVRLGWRGPGALLLVVVGLGADGGSAPEQFEGATLQGWRQVGSGRVDADWASQLERELRALTLWHDEPARWSPNDPFWGYGLKVPQIVALATRGATPFGAPRGRAELAWFPRRRELKAMSRELLSEMRVYLSEVSA